MEDETRELESTVTHSHTETDPRTLRDGPSIEKLQSSVEDLEEAVEDLDAQILEALEQMDVLERLADFGARLKKLEGEPERTNAQVIDPDPTADGPWGAANGAAERLEGSK